MSLPSTNANGQSSIRSFFQPKAPSYVPPPAASRSQASAPAAPLPPPPPPAVATGQPGPPSSFYSPAPPTEQPTRPASLHPQATISPILPEHVPALRRITSLLLPVNYPDSFYARLSDPLSSGAFSRVVLWTDDSPSSPSLPGSKPEPKVIGGLVCRPEPSPFAPSSARKPSSSPTTPDAQPNALYIQSLVLLSPYRHLGLAAALLDEVVRLAAASPFACAEVYAHVWTDNADGLRWYVARGFAKHGEVKGYYFKLRPDSAWIVRRRIAGSGPTTAAAVPTLDAGTSTPTPAAVVVQPSVTAAAANLLSKPPRSGPGGPAPNRGLSYQNARPDTEWNDLPADMHASRTPGASAPGSGASSRSSSSAAPRKKKDRAYPAAAFGK